MYECTRSLYSNIVSSLHSITLCFLKALGDLQNMEHLGSVKKRDQSNVGGSEIQDNMKYSTPVIELKERKNE